MADDWPQAATRPLPLLQRGPLRPQAAPKWLEPPEKPLQVVESPLPVAPLRNLLEPVAETPVVSSGPLSLRVKLPDASLRVLEALEWPPETS